MTIVWSRSSTDSDPVQATCKLICQRAAFAVIIGIFLFWLTPGLTFCRDNIHGSADAERIVDSIVNEWLAPDEPGLAITVVRGDSIILTQGYGMANLEHNIPVTPATVFNLGSVSKQFTGFAIAMLADQGLIALDTDIHTYLPELSISEKVTIRQLLDHTSGFKDEANLLSLAGYWMEDAVTHDQVVRLLLRQEELLFEPGTEWQYSNSGYTLLAEVVSRVTGKSFSEWMYSNIFDPLDMTHTQFLDDRTKIVSHMADSYDINANNSFIKTLLSYSNVGSTNLITTAEDMARWSKNLIQPMVGSNHVLQMYDSRGILASGDTTDYAFGQFVGTHRGLRRFFHSGTLGSFNCAVLRYPDQQFVITVLGNSSLIKPVTIASQVAEIFLQNDMNAAETYNEQSRPIEGSTVELQRQSVPLSTYVGKYKLEATGKVLEVTERDGKLSLANISDSPLLLNFDNAGHFTLAGVGAKVTFDFDENEEATKMVLHFGATPLEAERIHFLNLSTDELNAFSGLYYSDELMAVYDLIVDSGNLLARHGRYPDAVLTPIDTLVYAGSSQWLREVRFETNEESEIKGFRASSGRAKNVYFRKLE